ncbi:hypothetical protein ACSBR2_036153 [Camellia fascicularis]
MTATMRMLAYGVAADSVDDYVRIGESTAIESLKHFVKAVVAMFSERNLRNLRSPNNDDISRLLMMGSNRGFPGLKSQCVWNGGVSWNFDMFHTTLPFLQVPN